MENRFAKHQIKNAFPFLICERLIELICIERLELYLEVFNQRIIVGNRNGAISLLIQLIYKLQFKLCFALICHIFISIT